MQGISNSKHKHLVDALLQLQELLNGDGNNHPDIYMAEELRLELEELYSNYARQMDVLADLIAKYHNLFNETKVQFLSPKLKALRKMGEKDVKIFPLLAQNIRLVYGT